MCLVPFFVTLLFIVMAGSALRFLVAAAAFVAIVAAATLPAAVTASDVRTCASTSDIGSFVGWCRCSTMTIPREVVAFNGDSTDPWCKVSTEPSTVHYCDAQGQGNCDLQCAEAIHECTSAPSPDNQVCKCALGTVRTVLRYIGPF